MLSLAVVFTQEFDQQLGSSTVGYAWSFSHILFKYLLLPLIFVRIKPYVISGTSYL